MFLYEASVRLFLKFGVMVLLRSIPKPLAPWAGCLIGTTSTIFYPLFPSSAFSVNLSFYSIGQKPVSKI